MISSAVFARHTPTTRRVTRAAKGRSVQVASAYLVQSDNVRMTEQLHHLNFTKDLLEVVDIQL